MKTKFVVLLAAFLFTYLPVVHAEENGWFSNMSFSFGGFLRTENSYKTVGDENWANQGGNQFNGVAVPRQAYVPPQLLGLGGVLPDWGATAFPTLGADALVIVPGLLELPIGLGGASPAFSDASSPGIRPVVPANNSWNLHLLRGEAEFAVRFTQDLKLVSRIRGVFDYGDYDEFDAASLDGIGDGRGIEGGNPNLYRGKPNYFDYEVAGDQHPNPLEWTGEDYQIYFPALVLEYNKGAMNFRAGNQQIAWGQALFFRVFDVADGLDLRRHFVLDYAQEEYADERVPALGFRFGWQATDSILVDAYAQKFQPTILGNPNTQYNVIPVQFTVHDRFVEGGYDEENSYGIRLKGEYGQWGWQAMFVDRMNPDGAYRWTKSGVNRPLQGGDTTCNKVGCQVNLTYSLDPTRSGMYGGDTGAAFADTAFEAAPGGVYSADEWFEYAARVRLHGIAGLNASINDFPAAQDLYASPIDLNDPDAYQQAAAQLNTFFIASGGLRGHIERQYFREQVYGLGGTYIVEGEPGGVLDQLILNAEVSYTPDRTFTPIDLGHEFTTEDSIVAALVAEKYYRFSPDFPATYFVLQYMHRNVDDMFGRLLTGYGGSRTKMPQGIESANYVAFAFQQPFPQDVYRIGFAALYDTKGSVLLQPGIKWKPNGAVTVEAFYSYIDGCTSVCSNPNNTLLSTIDYADEATLRLTYQF